LSTSPAAPGHPVARPVELAGRERPEHVLDLARDPGLDPHTCRREHLGKGPGHGPAHEEIQAQLGYTRGPEWETTGLQRHFFAHVARLGVGVDNDDPLSGVEDG
jgi:hypothetical protein